MNKIELTHLQRRALIYVRQSSMTQVRNNLESQKLQYNLEKRAKALGWKQPVIVDEDLGKSATGGAERNGFQFLLEEVCAANVGAILPSRRRDSRGAAANGIRCSNSAPSSAR